uniref:Uncharacterized protein n=1 Tax=Geobacter metallireducens TaxID=28232 RepID=A0A831XG53_GEOME
MRCMMIIAASILCCARLALAGPDAYREFPMLSSLKVSSADLVSPSVHEGVIMDVLGEGTFLMREKVYLIFRESEVNGVPAEQAKFTLKKGAKVRATVYRLPNKAYFVSELEIK